MADKTEEIFQTLGKLLAGQENNKQLYIELKRDVEKQGDKNIQANRELKQEIGEIKTILQDSMADNRAHKKQTDENTEDIISLKKTRNRAYVAIAALGSGGGIVGSILHKLGIKFME